MRRMLQSFVLAAFLALPLLAKAQDNAKHPEEFQGSHVGPETAVMAPDMAGDDLLMDLMDAPDIADFDPGMPPPPMEEEGMMPPPPGPPHDGALQDGALQEGQQPPPPQRKPDPKRMEQLKQRILEFKYDRMKKAVAMDDETWQKFFTIYKPAESDIEAIVKERNTEMKKLGEMMNGAKTDADVDPEMQRIRDLNKKIEDRVVKLDDDLKPVLSPRQRARLLVFEHQFNTRVREQIMKRRQDKKPPLSPEEREMRKQKLRDWWMKNHPAHPRPGEAPPPANK
jgi:hypothetical protein